MIIVFLKTNILIGLLVIALEYFYIKSLQYMQELAMVLQKDCSKLHDKEEKLKAAVLLAAQRDGQELIDADNAEPCEKASPEARARFFAAIKNKKPSKERHWYTPTVKKVAIAVASVIILLVMIPSTTEAGRKWITELIGKVFPSFTEYHLSDYEKVQNPEVKRYTLGYVPDGFSIEIEDYEENGYSLVYMNEDDQFFRLDVIPSSGVLQIDSENADSIEQVFVNGEQAELVTKKEMTSIVWSSDEMIFVLDGNIDKMELIKIANYLH